MKRKLLTLMLAGLLTSQAGMAQQSTHVGDAVLDMNEIIDMLQPTQMKTRGIRITQPAQAAASQQQPAQDLYQLQDQQWEAQLVLQAFDQQQLVAAASQEQAAPQPAPAAPPSISMEIFFAYNSAQLTDQAIQQLAPLGQALQSPELAGLSFLLEGHTDATGPDDYNMLLSQKRAQSVGQFLYQYYGVDPTKLNLVGRGESVLLDVANPSSGVNRRVSITTMTY